MTIFDQRNQQVQTQFNAEHITIEQQPLPLTKEQLKQNRTRMLERVQSFWIDGVLEPSVQGAAQIALELQNKPSAIVTQLWHVLREFDKTGSLSSADVSIVQVYDHANGEVLILGEPGSGKTTLLLELARELLARAYLNESHPMPVVFNLSSWANTRQPLITWLISELRTKYQVPHALARFWIERDQVLPLLDGLDEVAAPHRAACVEAINTYRQAHGLLPTVVCSRQTECLMLSTRLLLRTAVVVQPLTPEQIDSYLTSGGERLEALRQMLRKDADLRALASTPLMLNVLTAAYQGTPQQEIVATGSFGTKQEHVFAAYVRRMLTRRSMSARYTSEQTTHWLSSLARQMKRQSQTVFYIEQMQPDWLSSNRMLRAYHWLAARLPGMLMGMLVSLAISILFVSSLNPFVLTETILLGGLLGGLLTRDSAAQRPIVSREKARRTPWLRFSQRLLMGVFMGLSVGLSEGLSVGLCSILLLVLLGKSHTAAIPSQTSPSKREERWQRLIGSTAVRNGILVGLLIGLCFGLSDGLSDGLSFGPSDGLVLGLAFGLSDGLVLGLSYGLIGGLLSLLAERSMTIQLIDRLIWSPRRLGRSLISKRHMSAALQVTVLVGLGYGLSGGLSVLLFGLLSDGLIRAFPAVLRIDPSFELSAVLIPGLIIGLGSGLSSGLSYWFLRGLFEGVSSETLEDHHRMVPNQGIRRSAFNGLVFGLISTIIVGLNVVLGGMLYSELIRVLTSKDSLTTGILAGQLTSGGLIFGLPGRLSGGLSDTLSSVLISGLSVGLLAGLFTGGRTCLQHYILRFLLWRGGAIPWNYPHFLGYAAEHILLRRVGGGYIFLHRLLLDYFADPETGPISNEAAASRNNVLPPRATPSAPMEPIRADGLSDVPTAPLSPAPSDGSRLLPCGHEQRPNARFCSVCGASVPSESLVVSRFHRSDGLAKQRWDT